MLENDLEKQRALIYANINVDHSHPLISLIQIGGGLFLSLGFFFILFSISADFLIFILPESLYQKLQDHFSDFSWEKRYSLSNSSQEKFLQDLVLKLQKNTSFADAKIQVYLIEDEEPNAFALPGNKILFTTSLIKMADSQNMLSMILAHELGHFYYRDHLKMLARSLFWILTVSIFTVGSESADLVSRILSLMNNGFSRSQETKADLYALDLMLKTYPNNRAGITDFFETIQNKNGKLESLFHYFSTHPPSKLRIDLLEKELLKRKVTLCEYEKLDMQFAD